MKGLVWLVVKIFDQFEINLIIFFNFIFQELKEQLGDLKDTNQSTVMDMIHAENVKQGRDKYKTLKVNT